MTQKTKFFQFYRELLQRLVLAHTGEAASELLIEPHPAWKDLETVAPSVQEKV